MVNTFTSKCEDTFKQLMQEGYPFQKVVTFLLEVQGYDKSRVAKDAEVSLPLVSLTLSGQRISSRVKQTVMEVLVFDPWKV